MHSEHKILSITLSIFLFLVIILGSANIIIFDKSNYQREYEKNGVYQKLSENASDGEFIAEQVTNNVLDYFHGRADIKYFTDQEKSHMKDVKSLIDTLMTIYYAAAILSIIVFAYLFVKFKDDKFSFISIIAKSLLYSSIACIVFLVILFLSSVFYFDQLFILFHHVFFPQGNWMFDSSSLLITLFPQQFFFDTALKIFIYAVVQALIFFGIGWWINKELKLHEKHHHGHS